MKSRKKAAMCKFVSAVLSATSTIDDPTTGVIKRLHERTLFIRLVSGQRTIETDSSFANRKRLAFRT